MLLGNKVQPGCKLSPALKQLCVRQACGKTSGDDRADSGNCRKPKTDIVVAMRSEYRLVKLCDLPLGPVTSIVVSPQLAETSFASEVFFELTDGLIHEHQCCAIFTSPVAGFLENTHPYHQ